MISKKYSQRAHAKRRALERFGIELTKDVRRTLVQAIQKGEARFRARQSLRITHWIVEYQGKELPVVYDRQRHEIVTVLPAPPVSP